MLIIEITLYCIYFILLIPILIIFLESLLSLLNTKEQATYKTRSSKSAILIPAHNESIVIGETLNSILTYTMSFDRIIVIADNCTDDTAQISREYGVEVIERIEHVKKGKSYALDFAINYLSSNPPDVVVVLDADCKISGGKLSDLIEYCSEINQPTQCLNLMKAPAGASLKTKIAEFAWALKSIVRPRGLQTLNLPCQLMGTGMAFPWNVISRHNLASGAIAEDLLLGLQCSRERDYCSYYPNTSITSFFPTGTKSSKSQSTRWEHGHLSIIINDLPTFLLNSIKDKNLKLFTLILDASVPPLSLIVLFQLVALIMSVLILFTKLSFPLYFSLTSICLLVITILVSWIQVGRKIISLRDLLSIPFYIAKKLPIYLAFVYNRQKNWEKTDRK